MQHLSPSQARRCQEKLFTTATYGEVLTLCDASSEAVHRTAGACLVDDDADQARQPRLESLENPTSEVLAGRVGQPLDLVQISVVKLLVDRAEGGSDVGKVNDPAADRVGLAADVDLDAKGVPMQPRALMTWRRVWEPMCRLDGEDFENFHAPRRIDHAHVIAVSRETVKRVMASGSRSTMSPPPSDRARSAGSALGERALAELAEAERLFTSTGEALHRGIHHGRKALRRCRAALALAGEAFGERGRRLDLSLRRLLRSLSRERDAQAVVERLDELVADGRIEPNLATYLRAALVARRDRILARRLARDPGLVALRTRLRAITRAVAKLPWASLSEDELRRALLRQRERTLRAAKRAQGGGEEDVHRYRRRLRRLRQQLNLLKTVTGRSYARYAARPDPADTLSQMRDHLLLVRAVRSLRELPASMRRAALVALAAAQERIPA